MTEGIVVGTVTHPHWLTVEVRDWRSPARVLLDIPRNCSVEFGDRVQWRGNYFYWCRYAVQLGTVQAVQMIRTPYVEMEVRR